MYEIGVADNGQLIGLSPKDLEASFKTLRYMGSMLMADMSIVRKKLIADDKYVAEVLFRKCLNDAKHFLEIRVAILGSVDAGSMHFKILNILIDLYYRINAIRRFNT